MPTKSTFANMLNAKSVSKKVMAEDDMPQSLEGLKPEVKAMKMKPKPKGKVSSYAKILKGGK